ncbi:hypothetical protein H8K35_15215 [Undibacterium sp. LX40W]|uniref:Uncharacterized protein n=1 Tax=Undibacterium nitidum TaxID=2762298 RepID=A0A923KME2_9BURK|nr:MULTISPECIES: hypothetical protein [Undibacterium]MBC3882795.1 hypothetical protein [Undibacterium nitidum]MBC3893022.1 hypothetical protein [Undibacterium sp. LX40W]
MFLSLLILVSLPVCASNQELCTNLSQFANSSIEGKPSFVELTTFWGVRKTGNTISIGEKSCSHDQSEGAKAFCTYLSRHSSTEFPEMNFRRILACLQGKDPFEPNVQVNLQDISINIYESSFLEKDLSVRLDHKRKSDGATMLIEVKRWPPEKE